MSNPLVSIIIPTYNRAHLIGETLDSIVAQTYDNWECIIVDDGSTDNTEEIVSEYVKKDNRFQFYNRPNNRLKGANACRNFGFEKSKGELINWFDSDDLMMSDKLELQVLQLESDNTVDLSISQSLVFENEKINILGNRFKNIISNNLLEDFIKGEIGMLTSIPLIKKRFLIENTLFFDEELQAAQEWEFFSRLFSFNPNARAIDKALVLLRKHEGSISFNKNKDRAYHYLLARLKVLKITTVNTNKEIVDYINKYNFMLFKKMIVSRYIFKKPRVFQIYFFKKNGLSFENKVKCVFIMLSFFIFNKGYNLFNNISLNDQG